MSHNIVMKNIQIKDLDLLAKIVADMSGGKALLDKTKKTFRTERMLGGTGKCDACIVLSDANSMDIGLLKQATGGYSPVHAAMGMSNIFRATGGRSPIGGLLQEYALREAEYQAAQNGFGSERKTQSDGTITLELIQAS